MRLPCDQQRHRISTQPITQAAHPDLQHVGGS
jgi:hypothetical protein